MFGFIDDIVKNYKKRRLFNQIKGMAFWSYGNINAAEVSDIKLIEKVLLVGDENQKRDLLKIYPKDKVKSIWYDRFVIPHPDWNFLNERIAKSLNLH